MTTSSYILSTKLNVYGNLMCILNDTKVFSEISQNSWGNTCTSLFFSCRRHPAKVSKESFRWHRCFPVNFAKFLRTPFLQNISGCSGLSLVGETFLIRTSEYRRLLFLFVFFFKQFCFNLLTPYIKFLFSHCTAFVFTLQTLHV